MSLTERNRLAALLVAYLAASFLHFAHNAEFLGDYPNLPAWITRPGIYFTWAAEALIGIVGFMRYRRGWPVGGLLLMGLHAALGFDGLLHYSRAPFGAHTLAMNSTIWLEVAAAASLLVAVVAAMVRRFHPQCAVDD